MRDLIFTVITAAALTAGLPEGHVMDVSKADNITIPRPRLEVQLLAARYQRTGRRLAATRDATFMTRKKELYEVRQVVSVNVLAEAANWLADFSYAFTQNLPRGVNDARGNFVRVQVAEATQGHKPAPRVGLTIIDPMPKRHQLFQLTFIWRVTAEEKAHLITHVTINPHWSAYGKEK